MRTGGLTREAEGLTEDEAHTARRGFYNFRCGRQENLSRGPGRGTAAPWRRAFEACGAAPRGGQLTPVRLCAAAAKRFTRQSGGGTRGAPAGSGAVEQGGAGLGARAEFGQRLEDFERVADVVEGRGDLHALNQLSDFEERFAGDL